MSHFLLAVFSKPYWQTVYELLEPYNEATTNPAYITFVKSDESKEEILAEYEAYLERNRRLGTDESKLYTLSFFVYDKYGYGYDEGLKEFGRCVNIRGKWDWYDESGEYTKILRLKGKPDTWCNEALVADVDFSIDEEKYNKALRSWETLHRNFKRAYGTKENYARHVSSFNTWAFITPNGEWHEKGEMGWFGMGNDTPETTEKYIDALERATKEYQDCMLTIIDCHI